MYNTHTVSKFNALRRKNVTEFQPGEGVALEYAKKIALSINENVSSLLEQDHCEECISSILKMVDRLENQHRRGYFYRSLTDLQQHITDITASNVNRETRSKYANLYDVLEIARPLWTQAGFSLVFTENTDDREQDVLLLQLDVTHLWGHSEKYSLRVPYDMKGPKGSAVKTAVQGMGSAITYGRRYLLNMFLGISAKADDDDGNYGHSSNDPNVVDQSVKLIRKLLEDTKTDELDFLSGMSNLLKREINSINDLSETEAFRALKLLREKQQRADQ